MKQTERILQYMRDFGSITQLEAIRDICYYGSSTYDTKQMARLIDLVVEDCKQQGIETLPPEELERMALEWRQDEERNEGDKDT